MVLRVPRPVKTNRDKVKLYVWEGLADGDTCDWLALGEYSDKTVHVEGTWATATLSIEGSNMEGSGTFNILNDPNGNAITKTASDFVEAILENTWKVRPSAISGANAGTTALNVWLMVKK